MYLLLIAAVLGTIIGWMGGPALVLIVWIIAGLFVGSFAVSNKQSLLLGGVYGFFLLYFFMISGYAGSAPLVSRLLPFVLIGLGGAVGGVVLGWFGFYLKSRYPKKG